MSVIAGQDLEVLSALPNIDKSTKIFVIIKNQDQVVPPEASKKLIDKLFENKLKTKIFYFDGPHEVDLKIFSQ